jgi:hypothetical protein
MRFWQLFWTISLVVAGSSFAFITLVVSVRGGRDLRQMFRDLSKQLAVQKDRDK